MKLFNTLLGAMAITLALSAFSIPNDLVIKSDKTIGQNGVTHYTGNVTLDNKRDVYIEAEQMTVKDGSKQIQIKGLKKFGVKSVRGNTDLDSNPEAIYNKATKELIIK